MMFEMKPYRRDTMSTWNPFSAMEDMEKHFFDNNFFSSHGLAEFKTDITDEGDHYEMKADLPGFQKEDIHLDLEGDTLNIRAERHSEHEDQDKKGKFVRCERSYGAYNRSFDITGIKGDAITASYDGGVLTLEMPKQDTRVDTTRHLEIQ
jgi:HSP20 family protein